ncbi:hypothetical protein EZV62_011521 [Acer yangbiense]|uniref:NPH3 domain-containing protein n=1 Tax=Acer yangbiense TaxID=1000413 RepID=A0A5C7I5J9_9ROSI|nr:hypothetical protein EZV62_011521 [Acer yangbiense]
MKFMKLGSKPDSFQTDDNNIRYVQSELASDITVAIGDVKFHLHKAHELLASQSQHGKAKLMNNIIVNFLLSKSACLQKLVATANEDNSNEVDISDIPGGPAAFEICAKFCYGMTVTLISYNVVAAEYLGMHEAIEKGNLIYKVINQCIEAIAIKACVDVSKVDWSYTYNRKKLPEENGNDPNYWNVNIKTKVRVPDEVIGEALKAYACRRLSGFYKGMIQCKDVGKYRSVVDTIVWLLPAEKGSVSCSFLLKLLKAAITVDSSDMVKGQLVRRIGQQLEEANVNDILIRVPVGESTKYDVDMDRNLPFSKFIDLAEMVSSISRPAHDWLYRAIDTCLKEHPANSKSERKKICKLMDCRKLSVDACMHAVQNERLPLRVVQDLKNGSYGSSRSIATNPVEDWDAVATAEELKALRMANGVGGSERNGNDSSSSIDKAAVSKMKWLLKSKKIFT